MQKKYKAEVATAVKPLAPIKCEKCKRRFTPKYPEQRYCSRACYTAYLKTHAPGHRLEKLFKPRNIKQPLTDPLDEIDDELWAERAKYWESQSPDQKPLSKMYGRGAIRERRPLVLTGHGIRLKVERGWSETVHMLDLIKKSLKHRATDFTQLRMLEAVAAQMYFAAWRKITLNWKEDRKRPIPDDWRFFTQRESLAGVQNRHATHPVNAMLNYAYRVLETQVRIAAVAAGLDPTIGYLHVCRPGRAAVVYDLMEPLRPKIDRMILDFVRSHIFMPTDFLLIEGGVCRLHPQLVRRVIGLSLDNQTVYGVVSQTITSLRKEGGEKG